MRSRDLPARALAWAVAGALALPGQARAAAKWGADYFPNLPLVTQDGKQLRFYDDLLRGKVVAIQFFYTHCESVCPAETANLRRVQRLLGDRVGKDIHFYSISIDPKVDTPEELRKFSERFGAKWTFLSGKDEDVRLLRKKLGVFREGPGSGDPGTHSASIVVGNEPQGIWVRRSGFDEPRALARLLGTTLQGAPTPESERRSYAAAPTLQPMSRGEDLFRSRCASCHSLGPESGVGPGLAGVTRARSREWLTRWLKAPDQMLDQKDPIATELLARFNQVRMPNLRLDDAEVDSLIEFLETRKEEPPRDADSVRSPSRAAESRPRPGDRGARRAPSPSKAWARPSAAVPAAPSPRAR